MPESHGPPVLLVAGNRTSVFLERGNSGDRVRKQLRPFADVKNERVALHREAFMQNLAAGPGVVPVLGGQLEAAGLPALPEHGPDEFRVLLRPYLPGYSLRELLSQPAPCVNLLRTHAIPWLCQLALILERIHALRSDKGALLGLVHRDVTSDNVLVDVDRRVWLNDFGLAHLRAEGALADNRLLQGSRPFLPPELSRGEQPSQKSDVYQAALLGAMLLDIAPVRAQSRTLDDARALARDPALPSELRVALALDPDKRPSSAELARSLS